MVDHATEIRRAIVKGMKQDADLYAILGSRVYDEVKQNTTWPFARLDPPSLRKYESSCGVGYEGTWQLNLFARGAGTSTINDLQSKVFSFLENSTLSIEAFSRFDLDFESSDVRHDGAETSDYHCTVVFRTVSV